MALLKLNRMQKHWAILSKFKAVFLLITIAFFVSCSGDKAKLANSLPENSALVLKLNSESIFSDSFLDLLQNMDLMKDAMTGPYKEVLTDPSKAGIERLSDFYVFVSGKDASTSRMGGIVPLNDAEKFKEFLTAQKLTITEVAGVQTVSKGNEYTIVWDKTKAIFYYSALGGELVKEASALLKQEDGTALNKIATVTDLAKSESHFTIWVNNENFLGLFNAALQMAPGVGMSGLNSDMKDSYSLSFVDFKDGEITVTIKQYLNDAQVKQQKLLSKANSVKSLLAVTGNENPYAWVSMSVNTKGITDALKNYGALKDQLNSMLGGFITIDEAASLISGDLYVAFNGVDKQKKMVENSEFDFETGEYTTKMEEEEQIKPFVSAAIGLSDAKKVQEKLNPLLASLPIENGIYNLNNEGYFAFKNNLLVIGSGEKSKALVVAPNGKLNAAHEKIATTQPSAIFFDIDGTATLFNDGKSDMSPFLNVIAKYFNDFVTDGYKVDGKVVESKMSLSFKQKENSLILLFKLVDELKKAMKTPEV